MTVIIVEAQFRCPSASAEADCSYGSEGLGQAEDELPVGEGKEQLLIEVLRKFPRVALVVLCREPGEAIPEMLMENADSTLDVGDLTSKGKGARG